MSAQNRSSPSSGIAVVEFMISIPLLGLLLVLAVECGRIFHQYMILSNVAATAVRTGIQLGGLGEACFESTFDGEAVENLAYDSTPPADSGLLSNWFAQRRANVILYTLRNSLLVRGTGAGEYPTISSEFIRNPSNLSGPSSQCATTLQLASNPARLVAIKDTFAVRIEGTYTPALFPFDIPLHVESRSSYLFGNGNFAISGGPPCRPRRVT